MAEKKLSYIIANINFFNFFFKTGRKKEENKTRAKERANDAKKIQDLQRQVS